MSGALHSSSYTRFRALMVQARKKVNLTQVDLSLKLGRPQSFVSKYEGGERRLDVIEFIEVCDALGVNPQIILKALKKGDEK